MRASAGVLIYEAQVALSKVRDPCCYARPTRADAFATGPVAQLLIVPMHRQAHAESKHFA